MSITHHDEISELKEIVTALMSILTCQHLILQNAEGKKVPFVDTGVYTRNRAFRLVMSSKAGKSAKLQNTGMARPLCIGVHLRSDLLSMHMPKCTLLRYP